MEIALYAERITEKTCCTCACWTGTRHTEADDFVYSLDVLKGGCNAVDGSGVCMTLPGDGCRAWRKWCELEIEETAMRIPRSAASRYGMRSN